MPKKNTRNTRGRIISAAWKLFYENGYEETTIEDILFESGTSRGSFYHYFEGKGALLYDWCLCGGEYSLVSYTDRRTPEYLETFRRKER